MNETLGLEQAPEAGFSPAELEQFAGEGFVVCRGLAPASLAKRMLEVARQQLAQAVPPVEFEAELRYPGAPPSLEAEGGRTIRRLLRAQSRDFAFTEWVSHPRLRTRLEQLLGRPLVMPLAHHNCIMTKQPRFSSDTGWHQDIRNWAFETGELVNAWLALGPEREENGCMRVIPGSHRLELETRRFDAARFLREDLPENRSLLERQQTVELEPGDVLFFHARLLHAATRNRSPQTKYSVVFTFRNAANRPRPGTRSSSLPELLFPD